MQIATRSPRHPSSLFWTDLQLKWEETGWAETPASRTLYSRIPPPSVGIPASLFYLSCKMLRNIAKFSYFSPGSRHSRNPASRPLSSRLPYPSRPLFSRAPAHLSPSTLKMCGNGKYWFYIVDALNLF